MPQLLLLTLLSLWLSSCQQAPENVEERHRKQILTFNVFSEPPTLDPGMAADSTSMNILVMLFDGLTRLSDTSTPAFAVAESVDISDDAMTYTFHLKHTKWSNGDPVTAHDFEYAWKRHLSPTYPGEYTYQLYFVKGAQKAKEGRLPLSEVGVRAVDDYTLVVDLENPTPFFLELLAIPVYYPLHRQTVEHSPNWSFEAGADYISNGPFELSKWTHHNELVLERNPNYWDAGHVKLSKIVAMMVEDANTELALFEDGAVDWAGKPVSIGVPTDSMVTLDKQGLLQHHPAAASYFYVFNINKPPFNNVKIRRAFAMAINRAEIVKNVTKGGETPATCLVPPALSLQKTACFHDADVKEARKLFTAGLMELGLTKEQLPPIAISYNTGEGHHKIAQAVQQQWSDAFGIKIGLENQEWKVYLDKVNARDFTIARMGWQASYNDPYVFLDLFKYRDAPMNIAKWEDPTFTKLLDESLAIRSPDERKKLLAQAEALVVEQMPIAPLYFQTNTYLKSPELKGFFFTPIGDVDFRYAYFEKREEND